MSPTPTLRHAALAAMLILAAPVTGAPDPAAADAPAPEATAPDVTASDATPLPAENADEAALRAQLEQVRALNARLRQERELLQQQLATVQAEVVAGDKRLKAAEVAKGLPRVWLLTGAGAGAVLLGVGLWALRRRGKAAGPA